MCIFLTEDTDVLHPTVVIQHSFIEVSGDVCYSRKLVSCWGLLMPSSRWLQIPYAEYITWAMYYEASSTDPGRVFVTWIHLPLVCQSG